MIYEVARDGEKIGSFTDEELVEAVEQGSVLLDDDAWTEGMEDWAPVESLLEIEEIDEPEAAASPAPISPPRRTAPPVRPRPTPLGRTSPTGYPQTSHYYHVDPQPVPAAPQTPAEHAQGYHPQMVLGTPPPVMVRGAYDVAPGRYGTPGIAIASLVLGILSLVMFCFTALPAIICGHRALDRIKRSGGGFRGEGVAITGLVLGYVMMVLSVPALTWFVTPQMTFFKEKVGHVRAANSARTLIVQVRAYAHDHGGAFPPTLEEAVDKSPLDQANRDDALHTARPEGWLGDPGWEYLGSAINEDTPPNTQVFVSKFYSTDGKRIVALKDGSVSTIAGK